MSGEITSREEFEAWSAAAAAAAAAAAEAGGGVHGSADTEGGPSTFVPIEEVYSARGASPSGINWVPIIQTVLDQLVFLGFFAWLATPAIRECHPGAQESRCVSSSCTRTPCSPAIWNMFVVFVSDKTEDDYACTRC